MSTKTRVRLPMTAKNTAKRLVLLDSHAILHRAYHALPDFSSSKGEPTGALYGLVSMLFKLVADLKPDYLVATRDLPGGTHRHEVFDEYKGTREKTEDALITQLEQAPNVFKAFGVPVYEAPGFEADDCLATIVEQLAKKEGVDIVIATGDLDTLQLVDNARVQVYTLRQGLNDTILYDEDRVRERFGFGPEMIPDYKGLRGDPSDNIKGVSGIGEKTATELITEFGSIENIYQVLKEDPDEFAKAGIKPRVVKLLTEGEKDALFSKGLATVRRDAPITFELPEKEWHFSDYVDSVSALCDTYEFRSLKERAQALVKKMSGAKVASSAQGKLFAETKPLEEVDSRELAEVSVALWLVRSDMTNPSQDDILRFAQTDKFKKAREVILKQLKETGTLASVYEKIEKPLVPIIERMNRDGIALDVAYLKELSNEYGSELKKIAKRIYTHAGHEFNINSPKQLADVLFDELQLSLPKQKKTATGARTTREDELQKMSAQHPIIADVLAYRELQKLLSTYIDKMHEYVSDDGRLHAEFLQAGTTTGRMASQNPNLQNIPIRTEYGRRIRRAFTASPGFVVAALDYSQIELRIAAGLSGDKKLVEVFTKGGDIHTAVAAAVFSVSPDKVDYEMRRRAKIVNFGILYGMGVNALRANLGADVPREEAAQYLSDYFSTYAGLAQFIEETKKSAAQHGYTETLFGRRRYFSGFRSPLPNIRAQAERMAVNAPIQGTQADIIKLAMIEADALIEKEGWRNKVRLLLQVHDELVYEVAEKEAKKIVPRLKEVMESVAPIRKLSNVPIIAEVKTGPNWGELEKVQ